MCPIKIIYGHVTSSDQSDAFVATHVATCTIAPFGVVQVHVYPIVYVWEA